MNEEEIISAKALRKLDTLFLRNKLLYKNKELQLQIISWAKELLSESRKEWCRQRKTTLKTIIQLDRKNEAQKRG